MGNNCWIGGNSCLYNINVEGFQPFELHNIPSYIAAINPHNKRGCVEKVIFRTLRELNKPIDISKSIGFSCEALQ